MSKTKIIILVVVIVIIVAVAIYFLYQFIMNNKAKENALAYTPMDSDSTDTVTDTMDQGAVNMSAFLRLIRKGESSEGDDAYTMQFGGGHFDNGFADHPRQLITVYVASMKKNLTSDAAGAYQYLSTTWDNVAKNCGFTDFSPANQDKGAVYLITQRGAYDDVINGDIVSAMSKCRNEWASLPGSPYGQPTQQASAALDVYSSYGGVLA